jgi:hypothetical protein
MILAAKTGKTGMPVLSTISEPFLMLAMVDLNKGVPI